MKLTKNTVYILVAAVAALAVLLVVLLSGGKKTAETVHRQNENQIVAFRDSSRVEYYYENPKDGGTVDLQLQLIIDGPYTVAEATLLPGETGTLTQTLRGEPYTPFVPNVYTGRILVFDHETGRLKERVYGLEFRLYDSVDDPYDALQPAPASDREPVLSETENRLDHYQIYVYPDPEEMLIGLSGLDAQARNIDTKVYAIINGEEILAAEVDDIPPKSLYFVIDMELGVAGLLEEGVIYDVCVDSSYSDTGELFESVPGTMEIYKPGN